MRGTKSQRALLLAWISNKDVYIALHASAQRLTLQYISLKKRRKQRRPIDLQYIHSPQIMRGTTLKSPNNDNASQKYEKKEEMDNLSYCTDTFVSSVSVFPPPPPPPLFIHSLCIVLALPKKGAFVTTEHMLGSCSRMHANPRLRYWNDVTEHGRSNTP